MSALVSVGGKYYICDRKHKDFKFLLIHQYYSDWDDCKLDRHWKDCYLTSKLKWWIDPKYVEVYLELFPGTQRLTDGNFANDLTTQADFDDLMKRYPDLRAKVKFEIE